jgi:hypothetical protein
MPSAFFLWLATVPYALRDPAQAQANSGISYLNQNLCI